MNVRLHFTHPFALPRQRWFAVSAVLLFGLMLAVGWAYHRAQQALKDARRETLTKEVLPTTKTALTPPDATGLTLVQNRQATRALTRWREHVWLVTDGGLLKLTLAGQVQRAYTVLDGLPESDLTACAVFQDQLWLGTRTQGLLAFDGQRFTRYAWPQQDAKAVTALLADHGQLLIGTFAGGLLAFDGARFQERKAQNQRLQGVTFMQRQAERLYVGTYADGLWRNEAARWQRLTTTEGLPSNRVVGVSETPTEIVIATDFGLASAPLSFARAETIATLPTLAGLAHWQGRVWAVCADGRLYEYVAASGRQAAQIIAHEWRKPVALTESGLCVADETLWLLGSAGAARLTAKGARVDVTPFGQGSPAALPDNLIAALGFDDTGNLWAGTFRHGIAILDRNGQRVRQIKVDEAREINAFSFDAVTRQMLVATTHGVLSVNDRWQTQQLKAAHGLPSNSIASLTRLTNWTTPDTRPLVLATNRGLALHINEQWRVLSTVNGLPSNSTYAVQTLGRSLFIGTLSGLVEMQNGRVTRTFTSANSTLTHNWITALTVVDGRLMVGTYGSGVFELTRAGELVSLKAALGSGFVNPNALASDGTRLIVGMLEGALVFDVVSQRLTRLTRELPAAQVLSVAADERALWFGTTSGLLRVEKQELLAQQ